MTVGERIKQRREGLGLSVEDVARRLGKHRATVYRYESNEIEKFPTDVLEPLATVLQTTPAYLMGWENHEGDIDLGLTALDLAKVFDISSEEMMDILNSMSLPAGITHTVILEIAQIVQQKKALSRKTPIPIVEDERTKEFIELFNRLTVEQQNLVIAQIKGILAEQ